MLQPPERLPVAKVQHLQQKKVKRKAFTCEYNCPDLHRSLLHPKDVLFLTSEVLRPKNYTHFQHIITHLGQRVLKEMTAVPCSLWTEQCHFQIRVFIIWSLIFHAEEKVQKAKLLLQRFSFFSSHEYHLQKTSGISIFKREPEGGGDLQHFTTDFASLPNLS